MSRQESCLTQRAGTALQGGAVRNTVLFGEYLGQDAKAWDRAGYRICQRDNLLRWFQQATLTSCCEHSEYICSLTAAALLLLSDRYPSEPREIYQYLDALEVCKFELHVPVSGDLKEKKKQGVRYHNTELSSCSYSTERGTQWPSRHPEGWELLECVCLPKLHRHCRRGLCSWGCTRTAAHTTEPALNWYCTLWFKVTSCRMKGTAVPSASQICKATSNETPAGRYPFSKAGELEEKPQKK